MKCAHCDAPIEKTVIRLEHTHFRNCGDHDEKIVDSVVTVCSWRCAALAAAHIAAAANGIEGTAPEGPERRRRLTPADWIAAPLPCSADVRITTDGIFVLMCPGSGAERAADGEGDNGGVATCPVCHTVQPILESAVVVAPHPAPNELPVEMPLTCTGSGRAVIKGQVTAWGRSKCPVCMMWVSVDTDKMELVSHGSLPNAAASGTF